MIWALIILYLKTISKISEFTFLSPFYDHLKEIQLNSGAYSLIFFQKFIVLLLFHKVTQTFF